MIYTSYFANIKKKNTENKHLINIALYPPKDNNAAYHHIKDFAPDYSTLKNYKSGYIDEKVYTEEYLKKLNRLQECGIMVKYVEQIYDLNKTQDVILLCYEGKNKFCHRHILAKYLNEIYNLNIKEL